MSLILARRRTRTLGGTGGGTVPDTPPVEGETPGFPTIAARHADLLADLPGVNTHLAYGGAEGEYIYRRRGPYADENAAVIAAIRKLRVRHLRETLAWKSPALRNRLPVVCAATATDVVFAGRVRSQAASVKPTGAQAVTEISTYYPGNVGAGSALRPMVAGIEGDNEPDNDGVSTWGQETRTFQEELYAAGSPTYKILTPSMAGKVYSGTNFPGDLSAVSDAASLHIYAGGNRPSTDIDLHLSRYGQMAGTGAEAWVTEGGYQNALNSTQSNPKVPESVSGVYMPRNMLELWRRGVRRFYAYELGDLKREDPLVEREHHFGFFAWDSQTEPTWRAKPQAHALERFILLNEDPGAPYSPAPLGLTVTGGDTSLRREVVGKRDGSYVVWLWRDVSIWTPSQTGPGTAVSVAAQTIKLTFSRPRTWETYRPSFSATRTAAGTGAVVDVPLSGEVVGVVVAP